jgi:DNA-binding response OmpR family regulator
VDTRNRAIAKLRLLFVQPGDLLAPSTRKALLNIGIDSVRVPDGAEALRALARESFTAAIVDTGLPDFRGTELARHFRVRNSTLPLVLCGDAPCGAHAALFRDDPHCRVIGKPSDEPQLLRELRELGVAIPE